MHVVDGSLTLAATDLGKFLACRHLTGLDVEVAFGKRKKPPKYDDPFLDLLIARGFAHEKEFLEKVKAEGSAVLDIGGISNPRAREDTLDAMKGRCVRQNVANRDRDQISGSENISRQAGTSQ